VNLDARDLSRVAMSPAPFAAAAVLAWLAVAVGSAAHWPAYALSVGLLAATAALVCAATVRGWAAARWQLPASMLFLGAVAALRASAGGIASGAAGLSLIPVLFVALSGADRRRLCLVLAAVAAFYLAPIVFAGPPVYPHSQYGMAALAVSVSSIIGLATQELVSRLRRQAVEARRREQMLEQVGQVVRGLFDSADPRREVCEATRRISDATMAILLEPTATGGLASTAMAGLEAEPIEFPAHQDHPAHDAFRAGRARMIAAGASAQLPTPELWELCGSPESILFQPLQTGGEVSGVLVVGWPAGLAVAGSRATVLALLGHEAALAISRADQISELADMAQTDPLTGLPNRRAWDARMEQAVSEYQQFAIAMLDLDHFKRFNDTHGHPAGDRLLRDTAEAWRSALRSGDMLARLGGEEFGLILFDCDLESASDVTERLRSLVTDDQTCSVGLALGSDDDPPEVVLSRADRALYDAKAAGRDRTCAEA
jgi:diguanylate cyclase (GGDEF)-like protein